MERGSSPVGQARRDQTLNKEGRLPVYALTLSGSTTRSLRGVQDGDDSRVSLCLPCNYGIGLRSGPSTRSCPAGMVIFSSLPPRPTSQEFPSSE